MFKRQTCGASPHRGSSRAGAPREAPSGDQACLRDVAKRLGGVTRFASRELCVGTMKIAQIAPLYESCPPRFYGGTERVVSYLTEELVRLGHEVTLFASGDSRTRLN